MIAVIVAVVVCVLIYQIVKPPAPKKCGSVNGPPVTSPRVRLRDGRYLAYKLKGRSIEDSRFRVILTHGFCASKDTYVPISDNVIHVVSINGQGPTIALEPLRRHDEVACLHPQLREWLKEFGVCVITFDRPGYAESDPNPNRSPKSDAFDIQDLADSLELGSKFYVIGASIGCYPVWGCLRYLPHRLAGVAIVVPVVNYWWPSLPSELRTRAYTNLHPLEQWRLRILHYVPKLAWILQRWFPSPTVASVLKTNPNAFNKSDHMILEALSRLPAPDKGKIEQQGPYESVHRDMVVTYGRWEFDPVNLDNPFPDSTIPAHYWIGGEDGIVSVELQRHIAKRLQWLQCHEVPSSGHLIIHDPEIFEMIFKSLFFGGATLF